jgi:tetratricopeptide (TPR) repeat protein
MKVGTYKSNGIKHENAACIVLALAIVQLVPWSGADAVGRRLEVGQKVPEFSADDIAGRPFEYKHGCRRAMMMAFLSATQKRPAEAAEAITRIVGKLGGKAENLNVVIVAYNPDDPNCFQSAQRRSKACYHVLSDKGFVLWGKFGVIAMPTVIVSDANDNVLCVEAGHTYDFDPVIRAHLNQALGIAQDTHPGDADKVETATMDTDAARALRHLQMAKMLKKRSRFESAIEQAQEARLLDPNCVEAALELGELYCQTGQSRIALVAINQIEGSNRMEKARVTLLKGWAQRQMSQLSVAEKLLLEATLLNPNLSRGYFELGKIYQASGQTEKAMASYRKALALLFGEAVETEGLARRRERRPNISERVARQ